MDSICVGGGMVIDDDYSPESGAIYALTTMDDILSWCQINGMLLTTIRFDCLKPRMEFLPSPIRMTKR